jgi:hypothetical protein
MGDNRLTIRVSPELRHQLAKRAKTDRKDQSEIVREALDQYLKPGENAFDGFKRAGLIGISTSGPSDLSTNEKYLERFGRAGKRSRERQSTPASGGDTPRMILAQLRPRRRTGPSRASFASVFDESIGSAFTACGQGMN